VAADNLNSKISKNSKNSKNSKARGKRKVASFKERSLDWTAAAAYIIH